MELELGARVAFGAGKSGIVRFVGETDFASGEWVGLELERPEGKNNGELNGRVYFTCEPNHGLFVKKSMVRSVLPSSSSKAPASRTLSGMSSRVSGISGSSIPTSRSTGSSRLSTPKQRASGMSNRASVSTASGARTRQSLDRHLSMNANAMPGSATTSDEELTEARARGSKLEEELEQKNREVEQLRQSVAIMKQTATAHTEKIKLLKQHGVAQEKQNEEVGAKLEHVDADGDETMEEGENADMSLSMQDELAQQVAIIRSEAAEHVRTVRAELEDHISELQNEHREQLEKLRHENALQVSEMKALETEVAQQKARIAVFTAAEQKKAEDVALAVAKVSSGARKVETLEKQVAELQGVIEMMSLEKETIEMDKEIAEEHVEELQQEVEKLKAAMALSATTASVFSEGSCASAGDLMDENKKLRAAVKMLHERSSEEKAELSKKLRQAQRENAELVSLREEVEELTTTKKQLESETEELKELLDIANAYETMVEDLTEKNLTLGEKLAELETTVQSFDSIFSETDQQILRIRLTLGRIAGKSDILLQQYQKYLDAVTLSRPSDSQQDDDKETGVSTATVTFEQLVLGEKFAAVSCQAKEDLFMLECHLTTKDEFTQGCAALTTSPTAALENVLDAALSAVSEGALLGHARRGGDVASLYNRLVQTLEEWHLDRVTQVASALESESFGARCAVVKLRSRKNAAKLAFSISSMVTFLHTTKSLVASSEMANDEQSTAWRTELVPVVDKCLGELLSVLNLAQLIYRRAEIDLATSDDDLDGMIAAAKERLEKVLGADAGWTRRMAPRKKAAWLTQSLVEVATLSRHVKAQLALPRLVDLKQSASCTGASAHDQLITEKLEQSRLQRDVRALRERVGSAMREHGWSQDIAHAIRRGENVFGWQAPETERPHVLLGRVKLGHKVHATDEVQCVPLVLNRSQVKHLSHALVC
ncbi:hypothetical protein PsorP6_005562 [Peronosclerospora sorghi]|uniref:Uncharacterized protein n=1 Tax=Peronosclerospora sorghi TaxID=230839 RepID=A0ACC0W477_9STRA|nr:hypothetical protein PsorP6_005562 [Peronosclerospora sorghi]